MNIRGIRILCSVLVLAGLTWVALGRPGIDGSATRADEPQAKSDEPKAKPAGFKSLEDLLQEAKFLYTKRTGDDKVEYITVVLESDDGETTRITAREYEWSWKRRDGSPVKSVRCWAVVKVLREGEFKSLPPEVLRLMVHRNWTTIGAKYGLPTDSIVAMSEFFLGGSDAESLRNCLWDIHWTRVAGRKEFLPLLKAAAEETKGGPDKE